MYVCIYFNMFGPQGLCYVYVYVQCPHSHSSNSLLSTNTLLIVAVMVMTMVNTTLMSIWLAHSLRTPPLSQLIYYMFLTLPAYIGIVYCCVMYAVSIIIHSRYACKSESPTLCHFLLLKKYWSLIGHFGSFYTNILTKNTDFVQMVGWRHWCICVCMHMCQSVYVHVCVCMHACMYVCMHICMYVCMHACIHNNIMCNIIREEWHRNWRHFGSECVPCMWVHQGTWCRALVTRRLRQWMACWWFWGYWRSERDSPNWLHAWIRNKNLRSYSAFLENLQV